MKKFSQTLLAILFVWGLIAGAVFFIRHNKEKDIKEISKNIGSCLGRVVRKSYTKNCTVDLVYIVGVTSYRLQGGMPCEVLHNVSISDTMSIVYNLSDPAVAYLKCDYVEWVK